MAKTTIYGLPYEGDKDEPGKSTRLPGPLLADSVEDELARIDAELQTLRDAMDVLSQAVTDNVTITPNVAVPTPNFFGTAYWRGTETVTLPPGLFAETPQITLTAHSSVPGTVLEVTHNNPSPAGFDIVVARSTQTPTNVHWQATGRVLPVAASSEVQAGSAIAQLHRVASQSIPTSAATMIEFDSAAWDRLNGWSNTTNPSRWTPNLAGWYLVAGFVGYSANSSGNRQAALVKNGSLLAGALGQVQALSSGTCRVTTGAHLVQMNGVGDYLELRSFQTSGGSLSTFGADGEPNLTITYAGPA